MKKLVYKGIVLVMLLFLFLTPLSYAWEKDINLLYADASFLGEAERDNSGCSINGVGDINGDNFDDFLVGAFRNDEGGEESGQAYLFYGKATGWTKDFSLENADASFIGETAGDQAGHVVAGGGDINNDGYDDFLISSPHNPLGSSENGKLYIIFGKESNWLMDTNLTDVNASILSDTYDSNFDIAIISDVNGDEYDDILIGVPYYYESLYQIGKVYLFFGNDSGWSHNIDINNANASFIGKYYNDQVGNSVAGIGDVNGDTIGDFIIGSQYSDGDGTNEGQVYLIFGKSSGWEQNVNLTHANVTFTGEHDYDLAGSSISGVGDINGDTYNDFVIGAYQNDETGSEAGQSYLILGKSEWNSNYNLSSVDASFLGEESYAKSGRFLSGVGDINNDNYHDFIIGLSGYGSGGTTRGKAYLILGKPSGWSMDTNLATIGVSFIGEGISESKISAVAGGGDINHDGYDDMLFGAIESSESAIYAGQTYLIFGAISRDFPSPTNGIPVYSLLALTMISLGTITIIISLRRKEFHTKY